MILGIDPGCRTTGWAVVYETSPPDLADCGTIRTKSEAEMRDEIVAFFANLAIPSAAPILSRVVAVQVPCWNEGLAPRYYAGNGMSVARNAALAGWIVGTAEGKGARVEIVTSLQCRGKGLKMPEKIWRAAWNYDGRTSSHARDAAQIALIALNRIKLAELGKET